MTPSSHRPSLGWLTLCIFVLFTLLSLTSASEPESSRLFARQQQNAGSPPSNSPPGNNNGNSSPSQPTASASSSSSSAPHPTVTSATGLPPRPTALPPLGSPGPGTIIGGPGINVGPNSIIDPRRPVSRLSMIQPKQNTANPPLFAVGSNIVFEWAFENTTLVFPPANLTIEVSLTANSKMIWPVANVSGTATSATWNTGAATPSLFMGFYTLSVYDTKLGKQGVATSGHLMPYSDLQFGLYIPEPYVPRTGAFCETCRGGPNGAPSTYGDRSQALQSMLMVLISMVAMWGVAL
ncbi:hypothetical protein FBU30_006319 [Linnemannia zychae]|nr:hypothetical protein FBU30_006319 [Linnemannia zychae]